MNSPNSLITRFEQDATALAAFIDSSRSMLVLTGAGISTASGIPEYRDKDGNWKHSKPVQFHDFMHSKNVYRRYWARSSIGWQSMGQAKPNAAHHALVQLEASAKLANLITQNVDGLHQQAGHKKVINLHGQLHTVSCQSCTYKVSRLALQETMRVNNPHWFSQHSSIQSLQKPDGDAEISDTDYHSFSAPRCPDCDDKLKPDVVFFGETIPGTTSQAALHAQQSAQSLLVIGSSLTVFSGYRITRDFCQRKLPVALLNIGKTRADDLLKTKFNHDASELLPKAVAQLM